MYLLNTTGACGGACLPELYAPGSTWIPQFLKRNLTFSIYEIGRREYDSLFRQSRGQFDSVVGSNDPDLTDFRDVGGKMIMWHGAQDELIPPQNSLDYYKAVLKLDPDAAEYVRFFLAPGVHHCVGGAGAFPYKQVDELVAWVEHGRAPDMLEGMSLPDEKGTVKTAPLCPWPLVRGYKGGDIGEAASYECRAEY